MVTSSYTSSFWTISSQRYSRDDGWRLTISSYIRSSKYSTYTIPGDLDDYYLFFFFVSRQGVRRLLQGFNCGKAVESLGLPESATQASMRFDFDLKAFSFGADKELLREPRIVRVGLVYSILLPTTVPISRQKSAIVNKINQMINAAAEAGVNILCLQLQEA